MTFEQGEQIIALLVAIEAHAHGIAIYAAIGAKGVWFVGGGYTLFCVVQRAVNGSSTWFGT